MQAGEIAARTKGRTAPTDISNPKYFHKVVDCQWACPTHTPVPAGNPNIVHSGALSNTFAGVAPGAHRVAVVLGLSNHLAVQPPVAPSKRFSIAPCTRCMSRAFPP